jgi:hypothetical protein
MAAPPRAAALVLRMSLAVRRSPRPGYLCALPDLASKVINLARLTN